MRNRSIFILQIKLKVNIHAATDIFLHLIKCALSSECIAQIANMEKERMRRAQVCNSLPLN